MSYRRSALLSLPIISVMSLTACSSTHIVDTSPASGSPRIVASDVKVKVTPYADAAKPEGGRVEEQQLLGQVVMGRDEYAKLMQIKTDNKILGAYAEQCARAAQ